MQIKARPNTDATLYERYEALVHKHTELSVLSELIDMLYEQGRLGETLDALEPRMRETQQ